MCLTLKPVELNRRVQLLLFAALASLLILLSGCGEDSSSSVAYFGGDAARTGVQAGPGPQIPSGAQPRMKWDHDHRHTSEMVSPAANKDMVYVGYDKSYDGFYALDAQSGEVMWTLEELITSSPSLDASTVYVSTFRGIIRALDAETGEERWRSGEGAFGTPAVTSGTIYAGGRAVFAFDADTGRELWRKLVDGGGRVASPAVYQNVVYTGLENGSSPSVHAFDANSGSDVWTVDVDAPVKGVAVHDGVVYASTGSPDSGRVYALDAADGQERWRFKAGGDISFPAVSDERVYVVVQSDRMAKRSIGDQSYQYRERIGQVHALDSQSGKILWRTDTEDGAVYPVLAGRILYLGGDTETIAFDVETGEEQWRFKTRSPKTPPPAVIDGTVYIAGMGKVYALSAPGSD